MKKSGNDRNAVIRIGAKISNPTPGLKSKPKVSSGDPGIWSSYGTSATCPTAYPAADRASAPADEA